MSPFDEHKSTLKLTQSTSPFKREDPQLEKTNSVSQATLAIKKLTENVGGTLDSLGQASTDQTPILNQHSTMEHKIGEEPVSRNHHTLDSKEVKTLDSGMHTKKGSTRMVIDVKVSREGLDPHKEITQEDQGGSSKRALSSTHNYLP